MVEVFERMLDVELQYLPLSVMYLLCVHSFSILYYLCMMYLVSSKYCMWENVLYVCTLVQPVEPSPLLLVVVHTSLLLFQMSAMIQQEPYAGAPPQHSTLNT